MPRYRWDMPWWKRAIYYDGGYEVLASQSQDDIYCLVNCARSTITLDGDVAEAGVSHGATARLLARCFEATNKTIHLFDTFGEFPEPNVEKDERKAQIQRCAPQLEQVESFLEEFNNIRFYKGLFKDTLPSVAERKFCFVHIDCDLYDGTKDCCEFFYPRMVLGGVMLFHDYGVENFPGVHRAIEEFFLYKSDLRMTNRMGFHHVVVRR